MVDDLIENIIQAHIIINTISTLVDHLLFTESTTLARTLALGSTISDNISLLAAVSGWNVDQCGVAEENRAFGIKVSWFGQAEGEACIFTSFVVSPFFGSQFGTFSISS